MDDEQRELIRRAVDGELDEAETQQLASLCEHDEQLAAALERERRTVAMLADLPRVAPPGPELAERIMDQVRDSAEPWWAPLARPFRLPAWAMAAAILVIAGIALWVGGQLRAGDPTTAPIAAEEPARCPDPPRQRAVPIRFFLSAPGARSVALVGSFNDWKADATQLVDGDGDGVWAVTLHLTPGRHTYRFLVDGERWIVDPEALGYSVDGFGGRNAVISI